MTDYAYPTLTRSPEQVTVDFVSNTDSFRSIFNGATKTTDRSGEHLMLTLVYKSLLQDDYKEMVAFLAKLNGQQHRVLLPYHSPNNRGVLSGTPLVFGASQTGNTLSVDGVGTVTNWIRAGDVFSVNDEMKIATADANSSGGSITLSFAPRLRASPPDNDPVEVTAPTGKFMLASSRNTWTHRPGIHTDFVLQFIEDIGS